MRAVLFTLLLAISAWAADPTGKWIANVPGRDGGTREVVYNLNAEGGKLTGTASGFRGQEMEISDGKVDGDTISFATKVEFNGNSMVFLYKGKVSANEIQFTQQREGSDQVREYTAKRAQ
jgi:hypothetical protein